MPKSRCFYCSKEILEGKILCSSCLSFIFNKYMGEKEYKIKEGCFYCSKEIPYGKIICPSCQSFISMAKGKGIDPSLPKIFLMLSKDRTCEHCGHISNERTLELLKLELSTQLTREQIGMHLFFCPECKYFSKKMFDRYYFILKKKPLNFKI